MRYLSGLELLSLERPTGLLVPRDGPLRLLIPLMLLPQAAGLDAEPVAWSDEAGPEPALAKVLSGVRRLLVEPSLPMGAAVLLRSCAPGLELELDPGIVAELRERKDDAEIAALRAAGRLADEMAAWTATQPLDGLTELRLAGRMQARFLEQGHPPHPDFIVATGANGALPHHETGDAPIDPAAPLLLDFGCLVDGYFSDLTRVLFPPATAPEVEEAYAVVLAAHDAAVAAVAAGVPCEEVDRAARQVVEAAGQGERFLHRTGHGLGLEIHEPPYLRSGNPAPLEVGHVFSIEPGIYVPGAFGLRFGRCTTSGSTARSRSTTLRGGWPWRPARAESGGGDQLEGAGKLGASRQPGVGRQQRQVERLGEGDVERVVERDAVVQRPRGRAQARRRLVALVDQGCARRARSLRHVRRARRRGRAGAARRPPPRRSDVVHARARRGAAAAGRRRRSRRPDRIDERGGVEDEGQRERAQRRSAATSRAIASGVGASSADWRASTSSIEASASSLLGRAAMARTCSRMYAWIDCPRARARRRRVSYAGSGISRIWMVAMALP